MHNHKLWQQAAAFATRAHIGQVRKDKITPYSSHPFRVAMTIRHVFGCEDEIIIAAALLHDTIEDCDTDYDDILALFNKEVADLVALMTKDMRLVEEVRESAYDKQLHEGSWKARLIKLADVYDNLRDAGDLGVSVSKMLNRADRALAISENVPQLDFARAKLKELMASRES